MVLMKSTDFQWFSVWKLPVFSENLWFSHWLLERSLGVFSFTSGRVHTENTGFHEICWFSWNLPVFYEIHWLSAVFSMKTGSFHTDYWKGLCLGVFPSTSSRFHTENCWFSWDLLVFIKSTSFHEIHQFLAVFSMKTSSFSEHLQFSHWLLDRSLSGCVSFYFQWLYTENCWFSWNLLVFMKTGRFYENQQISCENWQFSKQTWLVFPLYSMKDQDQVNDLCRFSCFFKDFSVKSADFHWKPLVSYWKIGRFHTEICWFSWKLLIFSEIW